MPPSDLVDEAIKTGQFDGLWGDYNGLYRQLLSGFGPSQIRFLDFAQAVKRAGGIIGAFFSAAGLPPPDAFSKTAVIHSNVSPNPLSTWASLALLPNTIASEGVDGLNLIDAIETAIDLEFGPNRTNTIFTRQDIQRIRSNFAPMNEMLTAQISKHQPGFSLEYHGLPEDTLYREDLGQAFWVRAARRIYMMHKAAA